MAAKKQTNKPTEPQPFIAEELQEDETATDTGSKPQSLNSDYIMFPVPTESAGKGKKYCRNCNNLIGARSTVCPNCNYEIVKGEKPNRPAASTSPRQPRSTPQPQTITQSEKPEISLLRVLKNRGFDVKVSVDALDPKADPEIHVEKSIDKIMEYIPFYNSNGRFELSLDSLLSMLKLPLNKQ
jgi:hypothetical protein